MKKLIPLFSLALIFTACNTSPSLVKDKSLSNLQQVQAVNLDTAGLASFQHWKAQNELIQETPQVEQVSTRPSAVKKAVSKAPVKAKASAAPKKSSPKVSNPLPGSETSETPGNEEIIPTIGSGDVAEATKKKGVSTAVKGAVIGGVAGGAAGAVIHKKNRVLGGVIGGVVGAAVGYGVGKMKDKKSEEKLFN